jgi:DNA cross-link repair 1A protein
MLLLKVPNVQSCIRRHAPGTSFAVDGVTVHVLNANHTPGSAIFVFVLGGGRTVVHTGDFRAEPPVIAAASRFSPVDHLYVDCTFALSGLSIPPRCVCRAFVVEKAKSYLAKGFLVLIGTYTIGKEDLVADALAAAVFAPEIRLAGINDLIRSGWRSTEWFGRDAAANVHLVPIGTTSIDKAADYAAANGRNKVVAFQVTGWAGRPFWQSPKTLTVGGVEAVAFSVPYSDHSAPGELLQFVEAMRPAKLTSTTQTGDKDIAKTQGMFMPYLRKERNKSFIDFYARPEPTPQNLTAAAPADDSQCFTAATNPTTNFLESDDHADDVVDVA